MPVIRCQNLGKAYSLTGSAPYETLRERFTSLFKRSQPPATRWALHDVNLDIEQGDIVGLIGGNGAGKSTFLKLLARITHPTAGRIEIRGRVGSLLEVGTGFHPELTGRENIFLAGAVIGMQRQEVRQRYDEIVQFADIGDYLQEPVKRYSSGMFTRLAFSVAAHLDTEILLVDEVLAVGDARFQMKCLGKMEEIGKNGRTVIFVSHSMAAIRKLCKRAIWLDAGSIHGDGLAENIIADYLKDVELPYSPESIRQRIVQLPPDPAFELLHLGVEQGSGPTHFLQNHLPTNISITYRIKEPCRGLRVYLDVIGAQGDLLFRSFHDGESDSVLPCVPGTFRSVVTVPADLLAPGNFNLAIKAGIHNTRNCIPEPGIGVPIQVSHTSSLNRAYPDDPIRGLIAPRLHWETTPC